MDKGENLSVFCCGLCQKVSLMGTILILRRQKGGWGWSNSDVYTHGGWVWPNADKAGGWGRNKP